MNVTMLMVSEMGSMLIVDGSGANKTKFSLVQVLSAKRFVKAVG